MSDRTLLYSTDIRQDMFRVVLRWLTRRFGSDEDANDEGTEDTRFIPSELDVSVRYAHGGSNTEVECELANIEDKARRLEDQYRGK